MARIKTMEDGIKFCQVWFRKKKVYNFFKPFFYTATSLSNDDGDHLNRKKAAICRQFYEEQQKMLNVMENGNEPDGFLVKQQNIVQEAKSCVEREESALESEKTKHNSFLGYLRQQQIKIDQLKLSYAALKKQQPLRPKNDQISLPCSRLRTLAEMRSKI